MQIHQENMWLSVSLSVVLKLTSEFQAPDLA